MLHITKAASNTLIVTGTEKVTLSAPYYFLLVLKSQVTAETKAFIVTNISTHTNRYDEFTFTEGATTQKTLALGTHHYTLYCQSSSSNIDPDLADETVEEGIAYVKSTASAYETNDITQTYKVNAIVG